MYLTYTVLTFLPLLGSIPSVQATDFWTVNCAPLTVQQADPIVSPDQLSSHVHAVAGGTAFSDSMPDPDSGVKSKATTCDKFTDHSNYWCPQLYNRENGKFQIVPFTGVNIYYKRLTCDYNPSERWCPTVKKARPFPPGLRMLAGNSNRRTYTASSQDDQAILYDGGLGEKPGFPKALSKNFQMNIRFPSCWDGKNVDSLDHKSHMAYPDPAKGDTAGGMCPQSHPIALIHMGAEFGFDTNSLGIHDTSTLVFSNGDTTGYGGHGDFLQGWTNLEALGKSFDNCNGPGEACAWNSFGTPDGKMGTKTPRAPEKAPVVGDDIGLKGPVMKLPGTNAVYGGGGDLPPPPAASTSKAAAVSTTKKTTTTVKQVPTSVVKPVSTSKSTTTTKPYIQKPTATVKQIPTSTAVVVKGGQAYTRTVNITRTVAITKTAVVTRTAVVTHTKTTAVCGHYY